MDVIPNKKVRVSWFWYFFTFRGLCCCFFYNFCFEKIVLLLLHLY